MCFIHRLVICHQFVKSCFANIQSLVDSEHIIPTCLNVVNAQERVEFIVTCSTYIQDHIIVDA